MRSAQYSMSFVGQMGGWFGQNGTRKCWSGNERNGDKANGLGRRSGPLNGWDRGITLRGLFCCWTELLLQAVPYRNLDIAHFHSILFVLVNMLMAKFNLSNWFTVVVLVKIVSYRMFNFTRSSASPYFAIRLTKSLENDLQQDTIRWRRIYRSREGILNYIVES